MEIDKNMPIAELMDIDDTDDTTIYDQEDLEHADYLMHHGVKGMKWGIRKYQNNDGTLTEEGKKRYAEDPKFKEDFDKAYKNMLYRNHMSYELGGLFDIVPQFQKDAKTINKSEAGRKYKELVKQYNTIVKNNKSNTVKLPNDTKEVLLSGEDAEKADELRKQINDLRSKAMSEQYDMFKKYMYNKYIKKKYQTPEGETAFNKIFEEIFGNPHDGRITETTKETIKHSIFYSDDILSDDSVLQHFNPYHDPKTGEFMSVDKFNKLTDKEKGEILKAIKLENQYKQFIKDNTPPPPPPPGTTLNDMSKAIETITKNYHPNPGETIRGSYPELTDQELQRRILRLQNEQRYSDLVGDTKYVKSGGEKFRETLQTVGSAVAIAGSAVAVTSQIVKAIRGDKPKKKGGKQP